MRIIRGKYGRRRFDPPKNITARPTTDFAKENLFNVLENIIDFEGKDALDLFAGTGAISLELLSRGCREVVAVETSHIQLAFIKKVKEQLGDENLHLIKRDVFKYIENADEPFDFIFADPPYDHQRFEEVPELILNSRLVKEGTIVVIEHSSKRDFSGLKYFIQHREYGSVNFSIFKVEKDQPDSIEKTSEETGDK